MSSKPIRKINLFENVCCLRVRTNSPPSSQTRTKKINDSMNMPQRSQSRQEIIGDLLFQVLRGTLSHNLQFTPLPDNFVLIDEILLIPEFVSLNCTFQDIVETVHGDGQLRFSIRGSKVRLKPPELNKDRDVMISKKLSWILRHGAQKVNLTYGPGGFLYLDDILQTATFSGITKEDVCRVVETNNKQRFELRVDPETGREQIRAFQGHTIKVEGLDLIPITNASEYPVVIHGTYWRNWERIKSEGLCRMSRTHIHFAPGEIGESGVISGMRNSVEVVIYIDLDSALKDGFKFYLSPNRVILTEGDENGYLPPKYFSAVFQCRPRRQLSLT